MQRASCDSKRSTLNGRHLGLNENRSLPASQVLLQYRYVLERHGQQERPLSHRPVAGRQSQVENVRPTGEQELQEATLQSMTVIFASHSIPAGVARTGTERRTTEK